MGLAKSTYYFEISKTDAVEERNKALMDEIKKIFEHHKGRYGVRRIHRELLNRGHHVNHKRVQRLMHNMGLLGKRPKKSITHTKERLEKPLIMSLTVTLVQRHHYKSGLQMYRSSVSHGANATYHQSWI